MSLFYFFSGYFCPAGTIEVDQFPCPPGSYSNSTNLTSADECDICPLGMYCDWASGKIPYHNFVRCMHKKETHKKLRGKCYSKAVLVFKFIKQDFHNF